MQLHCPLLYEHSHASICMYVCMWRIQVQFCSCNVTFSIHLSRSADVHRLWGIKPRDIRDDVYHCDLPVKATKWASFVLNESLSPVIHPPTSPLVLLSRWKKRQFRRHVSISILRKGPWAIRPLSIQPLLPSGGRGSSPLLLGWFFAHKYTVA